MPGLRHNGGLRRSLMVEASGPRLPFLYCMDLITLGVVEDDAVLVKVLRAYFAQQPDIRLVLVARSAEELL
ncbi:MAG: hypothetical protein JWP58_599, partial [Hymenobacter sp.]|nr:hypothetical protein [Hymenobacter sp.]